MPARLPASNRLGSILPAVKAHRLTWFGSGLEHPLCWLAFQRVAYCPVPHYRLRLKVAGHAIYAAADAVAAFVHTGESDSCLVDNANCDLPKRSQARHKA